MVAWEVTWPRVIDGNPYGLNKGLLGFGSDNSRGSFDNVQLRILPPDLTLDRTARESLSGWYSHSAALSASSRRARTETA